MAEKKDGKITSYTRRKREESGSGSSDVDKPPSKTPKAIDLISENDAEDDPNLKEIWKVVKSIQDNTNQLLDDNRWLKKQYEELKASIDFHTKQADDLKKENIALKREVSDLKNALQNTNKQCKADRENLEWAMQSIDDLEQYTRKHNLEIHGITEFEVENVCDHVVNLGNLLNVNIHRSEIDICHRMASNNSDKPRPIIVRFRSYSAKREFYAARKHLRDIELGEHFAGTDKIYINENLTRYRKDLFAKVRKHKKDKQWHSSWSIDGKLFIKKTQKGKPVRIHCVEDLEKQ